MPKLIINLSESQLSLLEKIIREKGIEQLENETFDGWEIILSNSPYGSDLEINTNKKHEIGNVSFQFSN